MYDINIIEIFIKNKNLLILMEQSNANIESSEQSDQPVDNNINTHNDFSLIERADEVAKRIEKGNKDFAELLKRQEAILSRNLLSGRAEAGQPQKTPEQQQEEEVALKVKDALSRYKA